MSLATQAAHGGFSLHSGTTKKMDVIARHSQVLRVGQTTTNPALTVDTSTANSVTGVSIASAGSGAGAAITATSSATNENLTINAKGAGLLTLGATGDGAVLINQTAGISGALTVTSTSANALSVGANGQTNPVLQVDASTTSVATGVSIKGAAATGGVAIAAISSGTNEGISLNAKGSGVISIGNVSTGGVQLQGVTQAKGGLQFPTTIAITTATTVTNPSSGGTFSVSQAAAYAITLPDAGSMIGSRFTFVLTATGANNVTISDGSAHLKGFIVNDVTSVIPATGTTLTFVSSTAAVGDTIEVTGVSSTVIAVKAFTSTAGGITVA